MKVWVACVVLFFGGAELYQWAQQVTLPLPVYGIAGLLLAVLSNADQWTWFPSQALFRRSEKMATELATEIATQPLQLPLEAPALSSTTNSARLSPLTPASPSPQPSAAPPVPPYPGPQLPQFPAPAQPPISFKIHKPNRP